MTEAPQPRRTTTERHVATIASWLLAGLFLLLGASKLAAADAQVAMFQGWGYPLWFMYVVGAAEVAAALLLLAQPTAFLGATLVFGLMVGGAGTHLAAGELWQLPLPIVTAVAAALVALLRRPAARTTVEAEPEPATGGAA